MASFFDLLYKTINLENEIWEIQWDEYLDRMCR